MSDYFKRSKSFPESFNPKKKEPLHPRRHSEPLHPTQIAFGLASENPSQIKIVDRLAISKFPVFLIYSNKFTMNLVLKLYPFEHGTKSISYSNECRFAALDHPNIVTIYGTIDLDVFVADKAIEKTSAILMEYAPHGDFCDLLSRYPIYCDEVLIRTFFHDLIEALKYLQTKKLSHLDLKLENLLLGRDMRLKLTDFDLSYKEGDVSIRGAGTKNYRAPEIRDKNCHNPFKADIFSAGVILYIFITGEFPFVEGCEEPIFQTICDARISLADLKSPLVKGESTLPVELKKLLLSMIDPDPSKRTDIRSIETNRWYNGKTYDSHEVWPAMQKLETARQD